MYEGAREGVGLVRSLGDANGSAGVLDTATRAVCWVGSARTVGRCGAVNIAGSVS